MRGENPQIAQILGIREETQPRSLCHIVADHGSGRYDGGAKMRTGEEFVG